ncbi:MAG: nucleoside monophosphate kinase [Mycoplasmataceae bacterium]|jgi:adenylate kinase|nr:nucleoside monophosphate kinase [Mycoplasmataceae bacterium]
MKIVLLGAPGSGKGTLGKYLHEQHGYTHVSTGDLFRKVLNEKTSLGDELRNAITSGTLVSDEITNAVVKEELLKLVNKKASFILDGYPRTIAQARFLDNIVDIDLVILTDVTEQLAVKRIMGRRLCPKCGAIYNIFFNPPKVENICDHDGAFLIQRKDDNEEIVKKRFEIYQISNKELVQHYQKKNKFHKVDSNGDLQKTAQAVERLLKK